MQAGSLNFKQVYLDVFGIFRRNWKSLLVIALILFVFDYPVADSVYFFVAATFSFEGSFALLSLWFEPADIVAVILLSVISWPLQLALVFGVVRNDLVSELNSQSESLLAVVSRPVTLVCLGFATSSIIGLGAIFLVVPGLIAWAILTPAIAVAVNEKLTLGETLHRCYELTRGNLWPVFWIVAVEFAVFTSVGVVPWLFEDSLSSSTFDALYYLCGAVGYPVYGLTGAVIYFHLLASEGVRNTDRISSTFD